MPSARARLEREWASISWGLWEAGVCGRKDLGWQHALAAGQAATTRLFAEAAPAALFLLF
jgi:hypothetical protein